MKNEETDKIERLEHLIQSKSFHELTSEEKSFVLQELDSEEQYEMMKKINPALNEIILNEEERQPRPSTLEFLKQTLPKENTSYLWNKLFGWQMPAYATALIVLMCCLLTWWMTAQPTIPIAVNQTIVKTDTIYLASKPDTVFRERVVYRFVKAVGDPKPSIVQHVNVEKSKEESAMGVSMKDQAELEKLLVSGSK